MLRYSICLKTARSFRSNPLRSTINLAPAQRRRDARQNDTVVLCGPGLAAGEGDEERSRSGERVQRQDKAIIWLQSFILECVFGTCRAWGLITCECPVATGYGRLTSPEKYIWWCAIFTRQQTAARELRRAKRASGAAGMAVFFLECRSFVLVRLIRCATANSLK